MKHKKTRLFKHFMTFLNILALATPFAVLGFHALNDSLPKYFASQSVQHHGGESDVFSEDLDYANQELKTRSLDDNLFLTMESMNYLTEGARQDYTQIEYLYDSSSFVGLQNVPQDNYYLWKYFNIDFIGFDMVLVGNDSQDLQDFCALNYSDFYYFTDCGSFTFELYDVYLDTNLLSLYSFSFTNVGLTPFISDVIILSYVFEDDVLNYIDIYFTSSYLLLNDEGYFLFYRFADYGRDYFLSSLGFYGVVNFSSSNFMPNFPLYPYVVSQYDIPYEIIDNGDTTITDLDSWKDYYNNKNYAQIIDTGVNTHLPLNVDFVSLFSQSDIVNHDGNIATILFINFYCNWVLNISLIIFLPQVLLCFINWCIDLVYKLTETKEV